MKLSGASLLARVPMLEVLARSFYWRHVGAFSRIRERFLDYSPAESESSPKASCDEMLDCLESDVSLDGRLLILHSSMKSIGGCGAECGEFLSKIRGRLGAGGTLAMPVIRKYKEEGGLTDFLKKSMDDIRCTYDVRRSKIISGILPGYLMMIDDNARISRFPLNPLVAAGALADEMMEYERTVGRGIRSPHSKGSGWEFALRHNALIAGVGIRLTHHLTMLHVNEESFPWPVPAEDWYRKRLFNVVDGDFRQDVTVLERKPFWGAIYLPDFRLERDLIRNGILKIHHVAGIEISTVESGALLAFLRARALTGYPYMIPRCYLHK